VGLFADADSLLDVARVLRAEEAGQVETISPVPLHGVEEALENRGQAGR